MRPFISFYFFVGSLNFMIKDLADKLGTQVNEGLIVSCSGALTNRLKWG